MAFFCVAKGFQGFQHEVEFLADGQLKVYFIYRFSPRLDESLVDFNQGPKSLAERFMELCSSLVYKTRQRFENNHATKCGE